MCGCASVSGCRGAADALTSLRCDAVGGYAGQRPAFCNAGEHGVVGLGDEPPPEAALSSASAPAMARPAPGEAGALSLVFTYRKGTFLRGDWLLVFVFDTVNVTVL